MRFHTRLGAALAALSAIAILIAACSSSSPESAAVSLEEYFQQVQALHEAQESQSEVIAERFTDQLSGDEAGLEESLAALAGVLPEFLPAFRVVLQETRDGLAEIVAPAAVRDAHADLIAMYDEFVALLDRGRAQLEDDQAPTEVLSALFLDRSGDELAQGFTEIADRLMAVADREGIEGFVGAGPLIPSSRGEEVTVVADRNTGAEADNDVRTVEPSSGSGPGLSVREAVSSRLAGPLLVNGFVVIADGEARLCSLLAESFPPQCGGDAITVAGLDLTTLGLQTASGVSWTDGYVQLLGVVEDGVLVTDDVSLAGGGALPPPTDGRLGPIDVAVLTPGMPLHEVRIGPAAFSPEEHPAWESDIRLHYDFEAGTVFATIFADSLVAHAAVQGEGATTVSFTVESGVLDLTTEPVSFDGAPFARTTLAVRSDEPVRIVALKDGQTLTFEAWLVGEVTASFEPNSRQLFISASLQSAEIPDIFGFVSEIVMHGERLLTDEEHAILQAQQIAN